MTRPCQEAHHSPTFQKKKTCHQEKKKKLSLVSQEKDASVGGVEGGGESVLTVRWGLRGRKKEYHSPGPSQEKSPSVDLAAGDKKEFYNLTKKGGGKKKREIWV